MALYQGRALRAEAAPRRRGTLPGRIARVFGILAVAALAAHLPWGELRHRFLVVSRVEVEGLHYLDASRVLKVAGLAEGQDLLAVNLVRARQALLLHPRIQHAEVEHLWPRGLRVRIVEREPVLLVQHGVPWEVDSSGTLLAPLATGVVADVPLLTGPQFERFRAGTQVRTREVLRGLSWVRVLADDELQLNGQVSEVDVTDADATALLLMSGTRVLTPPWPPGVRELSALRVVLADLKHRGTLAEEVDLRYHNQVIVRPAKPPVDPDGAARPS